MTAITRADGTTVSYGYDGDGNQTSQTDGAGRDELHLRPARPALSVTDPLGRTTSYGYDAAGNRTGLTDPAGRTTTYGYDAGNELTSIGYSDGTTPNVSLTYTVNGQRASMTDGTGTTSYSYDALNRLTSQTNGAGQSVAYGYDLKGDPTSITIPTARPSAAATTPPAGSPGSPTGSATAPPSRRTQTATRRSRLSQRITASGVFDAADHVTKITDVNAGGATVAGFSHARRQQPADGHDAHRYRPGRERDLQLHEAEPARDAERLDLRERRRRQPDEAGERATLTYDAANELTGMSSGGQTHFVNDSSGNRTKGGAPGGAPVDYTYDQANRLVSTGGTGRLFAYAGSTACNAITVTQGGDDFSHGVLWSNGGVTASGASNSALAVLVAKKPPTCAFPSPFTPPGPTAVAPRSRRLAGAAADAAVDVHERRRAQDQRDLARDARTGVYCWTGTITIAAPGATFNGYEFVSKGSTQTGAITVLESRPS